MVAKSSFSSLEILQMPLAKSRQENALQTAYNFNNFMRILIVFASWLATDHHNVWHIAQTIVPFAGGNFGST